MFAAVALRVLGFPPLLLDLEAVQDTDHVIAVFRERGHWGAIAKSNFSGLRYREPVYRTLRELVMSYFEGYVNLRGDRTLRAYSRPISLARFDRQRPGWMTAEADVWWVAQHLVGVRHIPLLSSSLVRRLARVDRRSIEAARVGYREISATSGPAPGVDGVERARRDSSLARRARRVWVARACGREGRRSGTPSSRRSPQGCVRASG